MANTNVFAGFYNFPALAGALTAETVFPYPIAQGVGTGSPAFPTGAAAVLAVKPDIAGSIIVDGHPFRVRAYGVATMGGVAATATIKLYWLGTTVVNPATVPAGGNLLSSLVTGSLTSSSGNFCLETILMWDSVSQKLNGYFNKSGQGITAATGSALSNVVAPASASALQFVVSVTFSAGTANSVSLTEFSLEQD